MVIVNRDAEMVLVNSQAVNLFGWRREELLGQKIEYVPDASAASIHRATSPNARKRKTGSRTSTAYTPC